MPDAPKAEETVLTDPFNVPLTTVDGVAGVTIMNGNIDMTLAYIRGVPAGGLSLQPQWVVCGRLRLTLQAAIDLRDKLNTQIAMLTVNPDEKAN